MRKNATIYYIGLRIKRFIRRTVRECKDKRTLLLLAAVIAVMYSPVWGGYLLHAVFGWAWCSVAATACMAFWAGPFTPFFPICIAITLFLKKTLKKLKGSAA